MLNNQKLIKPQNKFMHSLSIRKNRNRKCLRHTVLETQQHNNMKTWAPNYIAQILKCADVKMAGWRRGADRNIGTSVEPRQWGSQENKREYAEFNQ